MPNTLDILGGFDEAQVADALNVKPTTLRNWRSAGKGPPWFRAGNRVIYPQPELREWTQAQTVRPAPSVPVLTLGPRKPGRPRKARSA